ncbi:MAG TPA: serine hydrolase [Vicinamibacterales bacterium]|nr:serine hydrolase [Vicinamibacterales bacterium]
MMIAAVGRAAAIAVAVSIAVAGAAPPPLPRAQPQAVGLNPLKLREAEGLLARYVDERKIAGAVAAVARRGRLAWSAAVGMQDLGSHAPMSERSIFRIYSMTKSVTAVAAMILQEQGRFSLDDPVGKYLPAFDEVVVRGTDGAVRPPARPVTVRDLMLHTSGLEHRTSELYRNARVRSRDITLPQFVSNIVRVPLMEDPGTRFRYSEGTTVLGRLVEIWSGQPLDWFLDERVLRPLRMTDTAFWVGPEQRDRLATVYSPADDGGLRAIEIEAVPFTQRPALLEGAVGLVATVPDYLRFAQMLLNGGELEGARILRADTVAAITKNGLSDAVRSARGGPMGWGLANVNVALDTGEYGWDGTAGTIFWNDPAHEMITILMTQSVPANPDSLRQRFKALVAQAVE